MSLTDVKNRFELSLLRWPVFTLFARSLRMESRAMSTYGMRLALVAMILVTMFFSFTSTFRQFSAPGLDFFRTVIYTDLVFITLAGLSYFASAITEEKEEMTLGLLKMTGLNPISILVGKSTSRLLGALMLLLAQLPFTFLAVTLGGVGNNQITAAYLTLGAYIIFLNGIAVFFSVFSRRTGSAAGWMALILGLFFFAPTICGGMLGLLMREGVLNPEGWFAYGLMKLFGWMNEASAFNRIHEILSTGFSEALIGFQVVSNTAMGAAFFLLAWATFEFFTREQKEATPLRGLVFRRTSKLRALGAGRAWLSAVAWKEFHFSSGGKSALLFKAIAIALIIGVMAYFYDLGGISSQHLMEFIAGSCVGVPLVLLVLDAAVSASRIFREEIKWKTLDSIAILPVSMGTLAYQKVAGCLLGLTPYAVFVVIGFLINPKMLDDFLEMFDSVVGFLAFAMIVSTFIFFLHLTAYLSLVMKRGALAVSIGIVYFGGSCLGGMLAAFAMAITRSAELVMFLIVLALLGGSAFIHSRIGPRLKKAAANL